MMSPVRVSPGLVARETFAASLVGRKVVQIVVVHVVGRGRYVWAQAAARRRTIGKLLDLCQNSVGSLGLPALPRTQPSNYLYNRKRSPGLASNFGNMLVSSVVCADLVDRSDNRHARSSLSLATRQAL